ncbi:hypothetical protein DXG01_000435 [Tephrocybe rancida]|nr:hypothetical protein DXG01_000435 [Tephrocybe rancida]
MDTPLCDTTPLIHSPKISETLGVNAYLKLETTHPSHSFKYRGITLFAQRAVQTHGASVHLIAASGGNAGLAAACAANALHLLCTVYLPTGAAQSTIDILRRQGARVQVVGRFYAEALQAAQAHVAREDNAVMVPAYDHETLWEGHGSMVSEIASQLPNNTKPDAIFCSVGGGGLLGGLIHGCAKVGWDDVPLIALETIGSNCFYHSLSLNAPRFNSTAQVLPPHVTLTIDASLSLPLAHFHQFTSRASGSLGASQPSAQVLQMALSRSGGIVSASVPDELSMHALAQFAVELACSTTLTPAYAPSLFRKLMPPPNSPGTKRTVVFVVCGGFKISLAEAAEYGALVAQDKAQGGAWGVLIDDGSTLEVEK